MNLKVIARNGNVNTVPANIGDIVFDRRTRQLYIEVVAAGRAFKMGLVPLENDHIEPPRPEGE